MLGIGREHRLWKENDRSLQKLENGRLVSFEMINDRSSLNFTVSRVRIKTRCNPSYIHTYISTGEAKCLKCCVDHAKELLPNCNARKCDAHCALHPSPPTPPPPEPPLPPWTPVTPKPGAMRPHIVLWVVDDQVEGQLVHPNDIFNDYYGFIFV